MKKIGVILTNLLFVIAGCRDNRESNDSLITVDVTRRYLQKEMILQDFMDVEYIALETTDEFITQGVLMDVGKEFIVVKNGIEDGSIFIFDRKGNGIRKINRKGQGGEEYISISNIVLDEFKNEIFVNDLTSHRTIIYDIEGKYKRSFRYKEGIMNTHLYNFDKDNLVYYNSFWGYENKENNHPFLIISKQDGSDIKEVNIPYREKIVPFLSIRDEKAKMTLMSIPSTSFPIIPFFSNMILAEPSADTLYIYYPNHIMLPFVARTPSIHSMDPKIFLFISTLTDRYYFMETVKKVYDFSTREGFPSVNIVYDTLEKVIYEYKVYNDDYTNKEEVHMKSKPLSDEILNWQLLPVHRLIESNKKGQLKGILKEIAAELEEESNPVIMLMKQKSLVDTKFKR